MPIALDVSQVSVAFGPVQALKNVSLQVHRGSITAILGPNGAGKTTLIERCEGFGQIDSGQITILGHQPKDPRVRPKVGAMLQQGGAWAGVRAQEMLDHVAKMYAAPHDTGQLAARLGIDKFAGTQYRRLSGGQQQRLNLALALVGRPELVFLDEPTASLDPHARRDTWDLLNDLRAAGVTVVLTTHYLEEAEALADYVYILDRGELVASGSPQELANSGGPSATVSTDKVIDLVQLSAAFPNWQIVKTAVPNTLDLLGEVDPSVFARFAAWCAEHDYVIKSWRIGGLTLEERFMELTGGMDEY